MLLPQSFISPPPELTPPSTMPSYTGGWSSAGSTSSSSFPYHMRPFHCLNPTDDSHCIIWRATYVEHHISATPQGSNEYTENALAQYPISWPMNVSCLLDSGSLFKPQLLPRVFTEHLYPSSDSPNLVKSSEPIRRWIQASVHIDLLSL